jgi:Protein of unknown function (DUF3455)
MTRPTLLAGLAAAAASLALAQAAHASVPADIAMPEGNKAYLVSHAEGVQIYTCNATATGHAWTFVAPRADLYDRRGRRLIGSHFGGPTWQAKDGSKVVGARAAGVSVDPGAIDWLLLSATSTAKGPRGGDDFAHTTFIQRINTTGGLAPAASSCSAATAGTTAEVPYTADYVFYRARRGRCD